MMPFSKPPITAAIEGALPVVCMVDVNVKAGDYLLLWQNAIIGPLQAATPEPLMLPAPEPATRIPIPSLAIVDRSNATAERRQRMAETIVALLADQEARTVEMIRIGLGVPTSNTAEAARVRGIVRKLLRLGIVRIHSHDKNARFPRYKLTKEGSSYVTTDTAASRDGIEQQEEASEA